MSTIKNFLLVFDHARNQLIRCTDFGTDIDEATREYALVEREYRDSHAMDIVLVGSDSLDTVRVTHSTYFADGARDLIRRSLQDSISRG